MGISEFIELAAGISMAAGIAAAFAPSGFEKYVKLACTLSVLLTLSLPAVQIAKSLPDAINNGKTVINTQGGEYAIAESELIERRAEEYLQNKIYTLIKEKTGVSDFTCKSEFSFTSGGILDGVSVTVNCGGPAVYTVLGIKEESLEKYLSGLLCCEVEITTE